MPRYISPTPQYLDANGTPYSYLRFYDTGTDTPKTTYSDLAETSANATNVPLDSEGYAPDIFFTDTARVRLFDSADVQVWMRDPVESDATANAAYDAYDATVTYTLYDRVRATNAKYYHSLSASNLNNEPSISPTKWTEIRNQEVWNTNVTYALGEVVVDSVGKMWRSLVGSNAGNTPGADATNWASVSLSSVQPLKTASFSMVAGHEYTIEATSASADIATPATIVDGDKNILHNASTSTEIVSITTTHTLKGAGDTVTSSDTMTLDPGETAELVAVSSSVIEVR